jgi:hypothetical protein
MCKGGTHSRPHVPETHKQKQILAALETTQNTPTFITTPEKTLARADLPQFNTVLHLTPNI